MKQGLGQSKIVQDDANPLGGAGGAVGLDRRFPPLDERAVAGPVRRSQFRCRARRSRPLHLIAYVEIAIRPRVANDLLS